MRLNERRRFRNREVCTSVICLACLSIMFYLITMAKTGPRCVWNHVNLWLNLRKCNLLRFDFFSMSNGKWNQFIFRNDAWNKYYITMCFDFFSLIFFMQIRKVFTEKTSWRVNLCRGNLNAYVQKICSGGSLSLKDFCLGGPKHNFPF